MNIFEEVAEINDKIPLTIDLVPSTAWYTNVRSQVSKKKWDIIRKAAYFKSNYKCQICGDTGKNQGYNHDLECHEIWYYDDVKHKQVLIDLTALCPNCHKVKHPGLAAINGESEIVLAQLMKVNNMGKEEAEAYKSKCFKIWNERCNYQWETDISLIDKIYPD